MCKAGATIKGCCGETFSLYRIRSSEELWKIPIEFSTRTRIHNSRVKRDKKIKKEKKREAKQNKLFFRDTERRDDERLLDKCVTYALTFVPMRTS